MPASCQKGSNHPQIRTTGEQESASLSLVRGKSGVWSEDNLMLNFVGAVFLSVVVLFFEVIGKTFVLKSRLAQRSGHCRTDTACAAPHQRVCTRPWSLHARMSSGPASPNHGVFTSPTTSRAPSSTPPSSCAASRCLSSTLRCPIIFGVRLPVLPPATLSRHAMYSHSTLFKDQPFQESARHSAPSSRDLIAQKATTKRDHITTGPHIFPLSWIGTFFSAEGGRRHTCWQLSPCATYTATSVRYPDFTFNNKKNRTSNTRITEPHSAPNTPILK